MSIGPCACPCCTKRRKEYESDLDDIERQMRQSSKSVLFLDNIIPFKVKEEKEMQTTLRKPVEGFEPVESYRKLIMPKDLNAANRLFGGQLMAWFDEAAALYVMCVAKTQNVVTLKVSEVLFKEPMLQGDFLIFKTSLVAKGKSSLTVQVEAYAKNIQDSDKNRLVCHCEIVFVTIDPTTGKGIPHGI